MYIYIYIYIYICIFIGLTLTLTPGIGSFSTKLWLKYRHLQPQLLQLQRLVLPSLLRRHPPRQLYLGIEAGRNTAARRARREELDLRRGDRKVGS